MPCGVKYMILQDVSSAALLLISFGCHSRSQACVDVHLCKQSWKELDCTTGKVVDDRCLP